MGQSIHAFIFAAVAAAFGTSAQTPLKPGIELAGMDRSVVVKSAADLGKFANGKWLESAKLPPDKSWIGTFDATNERNLGILHTILDQAGAARAIKPDNPRGRVGILYRVAMDANRANRLGMRPVARQLREIAAIHDRRGLVRTITNLQLDGVPAAYVLYPVQDDKNENRLLATFYQGGQLLPDRETYWSAEGKPLRTAYRASGAALLALAGFGDARAQTESALHLETQLARVSSTPVQLRDPATNYHLLGARELAGLTPAVPWSEAWRAMDLRPQPQVNVGEPRFLQGLNRLVESAPIQQWKSYLRVQLLEAAGPYLSDAAANAQFSLASALSGQKALLPRWKRAEQAVDGAIGEDLGQLYVQQAFPPTAKAKMLTLVGNLLAALRDRIPTVEWMGEATKRKALDKLAMFRVKVGYPDRWRDYRVLRLQDDSWQANMVRASRFELHRQWAKLGKPIDRSEWGMTPPTVNAYYNQFNNEIVFPAGILQPGFYDPNADDAANYGAIGMVMGHEISHGFDDQGAQYDGKGRRANWWTAEDNARFKLAGDELVAEYSALTNVAGQHVNGRLTLGENIADVGGLALAYEAYHRSMNGKEAPVIDGFTGDQRFFIAAAQSFRGKVRPEQLALSIRVDPHSPDNVRSTVPSGNHPAFYRAFGMPVPDHLPHVW